MQCCIEMKLKAVIGTIIFLLLSFVGVEFVFIGSRAAYVAPQKRGSSVVVTPTLIPTSVPISITLTPSLTSPVKVIRVIDGDTIEIEGNIKVRYIGIDTPETVDPKRKTECYGKEASDKNKELVEGETVTLEKDVSDKDKYGRLLRYVYKGNVMINSYLVREGYAHISTYPPDVKYADLFKSNEREARENHKGLWGTVCNPSPTPVLK